MAITTLKSHVSRAIDFFNNDSIYFAIAKPTVWTLDDLGNRYDSSVDYDVNPPTPYNTDDLISIIGYKKAEYKSLVVQDDTGTLEYRGTKWRSVSASEAMDLGARWVYLSTELAYDELPIDNPYRQVGVFTGLTLKAGVNANTYAHEPEDISDQGILQVIDNRKPVYRDTDVREKIKIILEF